VSNQSGTSNTLLLSHKGLAMNNYNNTGILFVSDNYGGYYADTYWSDAASNDYNWAGYGDHSRDATNCVTLSMDPPVDVQNNVNFGGGWGDQSCFSSSHIAGMPTLYADGSVHMYPYSYVDPASSGWSNWGNAWGGPPVWTFSALWVWDRGFPATAP
jgi:hypothetical protein